MPQPIRTFIAVELDDAVQGRALEAIKKLSLTSADVKWVDEENFHLTLHFLGEIAIEDAARVCQRVKAVVESLPSFDIEVGGLGAFPSPNNPRTIFLGIQSGGEELAILHAAIGRELTQLGFRLETRRYVPHLTLGRVRGPDGTGDLTTILQKNADFSAGVTDVSSVTVFSSDFSSDQSAAGPTYEALARCKMKG